MSIAPGWYPDPTDPSLHRYWDGSTWTAHTAPRWPAPTAEDRCARPEEVAPDGKLKAAGVMHLITGGLLAFALLAVVLFGGAEAILWLIILVPILGGGAAMHIVVGVGCVRGRSWARTASISVGIVVLGSCCLAGWPIRSRR